VVKEVIKYYFDNSTDVYTVLLDASRAFNPVNYVKLFIKSHLSLTVARFLPNTYTSQSIKVKWGNFISNLVLVANGVKQDGVLSSVLLHVSVWLPIMGFSK